MPNAAQELLLRAGLWEGPEALEAWVGWRTDRRIETADQGSQRLAPLAYHNLQRLGWDGPEMPVLKGTLRKAWVHNERLAHMVEPLLRCWHGAGVPAMLLKGAALSARYYPHSGTRPMDDMDVLVPESRASDALAAFHVEGWAKREGGAVPRRLDAEFTRCRRTVRYVNALGLCVEMKWFLLAETRWPGIDVGVWRRAEPLALRGAPALAPAPEHLLLHVLVHGAQWNEVPPIRWVADAWMILRAAAARLDWGLFVDEVRRRRVALPVRIGLGYLAERMRAGVPAGVLEALRAEAVSRAERGEFVLLNRERALRPRWRVFWHRHLRLHGLTGPGGGWRRIASLPESLRLEWRMDRRWKAVLAAAAHLLGSRVGSAAVGYFRRRKRRHSLTPEAPRASLPADRGPRAGAPGSDVDAAGPTDSNFAFGGTSGGIRWRRYPEEPGPRLNRPDPAG